MQKQSLCQALRLILLLPICVNGYLKGDSSQREECAVWQNVSDTLEHDEHLRMDCGKNLECTGLECNGQYVYKGPLANRELFVEDFCFGMVLEPCTKPTVLQVFVEVLDQSTNTSSTTTQNVTSDRNIQLHGAEYNLMRFGKGTAFMDIKMNHTMVHGKPHVFLSVKLKMRVVALFGIETWPRSLQVTIVPDMYILVPPCGPNKGNHTHINGTCHWIKPAGHPTMLPLISGGGKVGGPGGACKPDVYDECPDHASCLSGQCYCRPGYRVQNTSAGSQCASIPRPKDPVPLIPGDAVDPPSDQPSHSNTNMIIGACVGSFLLAIVLVVGVLLALRYKRNRQRYEQHDILLNNEDDNDDPLLTETT